MSELSMTAPEENVDEVFDVEEYDNEDVEEKTNVESKDIHIITGFSENDNLETMYNFLDQIKAAYEGNEATVKIHLYIISDYTEDTKFEYELPDYAEFIPNIGSRRNLNNSINLAIKDINMYLNLHPKRFNWTMFLPMNSKIDTSIFHDLRVCFSSYEYFETSMIRFNIKHNSVNIRSDDNSLYGNVYNSYLIYVYSLFLNNYDNFNELLFNGTISLIGENIGSKIVNLDTGDFAFLEYEDDKNPVHLTGGIEDSYFIRNFRDAFIPVYMYDNNRLRKTPTFMDLLLIYFADQFITYTRAEDDIVVRVNHSYALDIVKDIRESLGLKDDNDLLAAFGKNDALMYNRTRDYAISLFGNFIESKSILEWLLS